MIPADSPRATLDLIGLVIERLGIPAKGDDLAIRLGWQRDRGAGVGRRAREWVDRGASPPKQFVDLMHMLDEAGLLQPEAIAVWRGVSLEEAEGAVVLARSRVAEARVDQAARAEESRDRRRSA